MKYLSLFSGIEAASVAWGPLGWEPVAFAEIEPFPCAVKYPWSREVSVDLGFEKAVSDLRKRIWDHVREFTGRKAA